MKLIMVLLVTILFTGCAFTSYTKGDVKVSHIRLFTTADSIEAEIGDAKVKTNGQKIDSDALSKILGALISE